MTFTIVVPTDPTILGDDATLSDVRAFVDALGRLNQQVAACCGRVTLMAAGLAPFCPHWSCYAGGCHDGWYYGEDEVEDTRRGVLSVAAAQPTAATHADWLALDFAWLDVCDAVLRLPGDSDGADKEVAHAQERGIPVFTSIEELVAWA